MNSEVLDLNSYLNKAEKLFLLSSQEVPSKFIFEVRKKTGVVNFYERLESALRDQSVLTIMSMRNMREGHVRLSRPGTLQMSLQALLEQRPALTEIRQIFSDARKRSVYFDFDIFLQKNYNYCRADCQSLLACIDIFNFLLDKKDSIRGLLSRQLAHGQSTKIIGRSVLLLKIYAFWKNIENLTWDDFFDEFLLVRGGLEFRFYSPEAHWQGVTLKQFHGIISEDFCDDWRFSNEGTLILENYESFLSLAQKSRKTLLVWGSGWKAVQLDKLWNILPKPIRYWGDLDPEGIEIFNSLAERVPVAPEPLFMDMQTLMQFSHLIQKTESKNFNVLKTVKLLNDVYTRVSAEKLRLEQEQLFWPDEWSL